MSYRYEIEVTNAAGNKEYLAFKPPAKEAIRAMKLLCNQYNVVPVKLCKVYSSHERKLLWDNINGVWFTGSLFKDYSPWLKG